MQTINFSSFAYAVAATNNYILNHNYIKILESDWSRAGLISTVIVQLHTSCACNCTVDTRHACNVFEPRTATGSALFSYLTSLHTTTLMLLSLFSLEETIILKI